MLNFFMPYSHKKCFRYAGIQSLFFYVYMGPFTAADANGDLVGCNPSAGTVRISQRSSSIQEEIMKNKIAILLLAVVASAVTAAFAGSKNPVVGGQEMHPTKDILNNAVNYACHVTSVEGCGPLVWSIL